MEPRIDAYIRRIKTLDFVKGVRVEDGVLKLQTPKGGYSFAFETKNSYLDRAILNSLISHAKTSAGKRRQGMLLLARYVPRPSAERLIEAGIDFVDLAGNMHLALGKEYVRTVLGNKESVRDVVGGLTPAHVQLLFAFAVQPEALNWPVRQVADFTGIGKSNVAKLRQQFVTEGLLQATKDGMRLADINKIEQELLSGYDRVLRPKIVIGRFRGLETGAKRITEHFKRALTKSPLQWSLTGGPAASLLQRFYQGPEFPVFVDALPEETIHELRLLPDKNGPIIFLRMAGQLPRWKEVRGVHIAHPWLIFAELMQSDDPRAHEAAVHLKDEFLNAG